MKAGDKVDILAGYYKGYPAKILHINKWREPIALLVVLKDGKRIRANSMVKYLKPWEDPLIARQKRLRQLATTLLKAGKKEQALRVLKSI